MEWVDSAYASNQDTRKSVTGYVLSLNNAPVSWKAKQQHCVTLGSAEAEYVAASMAGQECKQTVAWEDNTACIQIANNPVKCKFTRHIDCAGTHNVPDALTKSLPGPSFTMHCPFLTGNRLQYKAFFVCLGITIPA
eukprot:1765102-Rhodomonas_salina.3